MTSTPRRPSKPEVLAPVGGYPQLKAAIESGADAVYFGLDDFNARARAHNFSLDELPDVMAQLHERGVQGFVTFNTLLFDEELGRAERYLRAVADADVDALILQDLGACRLVRQISPDIPLHASTQMTVTSAQGANLLADLGISRVVLARELSVQEVAQIAAMTSLELEVFVHGALCVSYSGQCFSSEAWGGRSANRGQCAQACRLPYDMLVDGKPYDLKDTRYLLSPQDLMGVEQIAALMAAGASCFKIEGRLKGPEYVALTTRAYRDAVDRAWAGLPTALTQDARRDLTQIFSRGLTPGFLDGVFHQRLVEGRAPRHRGLSLGAIERVTRQGVFLTLDNPVKRGDGLVFDAGNPQAEEQGGKVYEIFTPQGRPVEGEAGAGHPVELRFGPGVDLSRVRPGQRLWKTRDEALEARVRATYERDFTRRDAVDAVVYGREGEPLTLVLRDRAGHEVQARSSGALVAAQNQGLDADALRRYLGRMGGTPFELDGLHADLDGKLFAPPAELNALRREAVEALRLKRREAHRWTTREDAQLPGLLGSLTHAGASAAPQLTVLCRTLEQVRAVVGLEGVEEVYLDFLELKGIQEAVRVVQRAGRKAVAAAPRVLKPDEERIWRFFLNLKADALLVRSLGLLQTLTALEGEAVPPLYGDFSLNAANALSVEFLMGRGLARLAPTHDLNAEQLCGLAGQVQADRLELIVHHHLPVFHTEHCVFCRFLSDGNDFRDCGRPCEEHQVHLRDLQGREHVVIADMGCRNTVFNAESQSGGKFLPQFLEAGYRRFRVELLEERAEEVGPLVARYQRALQGELEAPQLWRWLSEHVAQGVTLGSLLVGPSHRSMKAPAR